MAVVWDTLVRMWSHYDVHSVTQHKLCHFIREVPGGDDWQDFPELSPGYATSGTNGTVTTTGTRAQHAT